MNATICVWKDTDYDDDDLVAEWTAPMDGPTVCMWTLVSVFQGDYGTVMVGTSPEGLVRQWVAGEIADCPEDLNPAAQAETLEALFLKKMEDWDRASDLTVQTQPDEAVTICRRPIEVTWLETNGGA